MKKMSRVCGALLYCSFAWGMQGDSKSFSLDTCIAQVKEALEKYAALKRTNPAEALSALLCAERLHKNAYKEVKSKAADYSPRAIQDLEKVQGLGSLILACIKENKNTF